MVGHLTVAPIELRVVEVGRDDTAFEIVENDASRNAAEELEHADVRADEAHLVLAKGELDELQAAVGECGDECIECSPCAGGRVTEHCHAGIIDLYLGPWGYFDPAGEAIGVKGERVLTGKAFEGAVTDFATEIMMLAENLVGALESECQILIANQRDDLIEKRRKDGLGGKHSHRCRSFLLQQTQDLVLRR